MTPSYAELATTTNFSFLRGASQPEELAATAVDLGLSALGIADVNSVAGVVRAHVFARDNREKIGAFRTLSGARLIFIDGTPDILAYPHNILAWGRLCRLLTTGNRRAEKGQCHLTIDDLLAHAEGLSLILMDTGMPEAQRAVIARLRDVAPHHLWIAVCPTYGPQMRGDIARRLALAQAERLPPIAVNEVLMHAPERRDLLDVVTCIREHMTLDAAGLKLSANAERHLKSPLEMARLFGEAPQAIAETQRFIEAIDFSLDELRYNYPDEIRAGYATEQEALEAFVWKGAAERFSKGVPAKIDATIRHELALIAELEYAAYFLTVYDIVRFARGEGILAQGRGSAANSVVCYCLRITDVDPDNTELLFERFISKERREPPDIDVDFEHERREEVIQYIYGKYGQDRTALAASVITYRSRSAIREVGKVFGFSEDTLSALAGTVWSGYANFTEKDVPRLGLDPREPRLAKAIALAQTISGFPRHLSQHSGGFVIARTRLNEIVPVMNTAMEGRTTVEWDKDDLEALGMIKVDVLALGMLTCLSKSLALLQRHYALSLTLATIEPDETCVYDMICAADTIGVFQIESRAQMSMLPRLRPRTFYDLVIEVAIVRPGPIQGDMVHPYLRRRQGIEDVDYPSEELKEVLIRTKGVPLFQEQAMKIAIVAAGFTPGRADQLRRAMATFKKIGTIGTFKTDMIEGMVKRKYSRDFAERCFKQIEGFGSYGFPESHAASFALLVYASAWMKCRYPDVFCAAILNSQPMGFYASSQLVRDAREHGVEIRAVDINASAWDCTLEPLSSFDMQSPAENASNIQPPHPEEPAQQASRRMIPFAYPSRRGFAAPQDEDSWDGNRSTPLPYPPPQGGRVATDSAPAALHPRHAHLAEHIRTTHAVRLGFRQVSGLREDDMNLLVTRRAGGYDSVRDVWLRTQLSPAALERLAEADAFASLGLDRRDALWAVRGLNRAGDKDDLPLLAPLSFTPLEPDANLPSLTPGEEVIEDYRHLSLSLKAHPVSFLRAALAKKGILRNEELREHTSPLPDPPPRASLAGEGAQMSIDGACFDAHHLRPLPRQRGRVREAREGVLRKKLPRVTISGLVLVRQRPGSASGVVFMTLEDETGVANVIVWPKVFERWRPVIIGARFLSVTGQLQAESGVIHVIADRMEDLTPMMAALSRRGSEIESIARADEVRHPQHPRDQARRVLPKGRNFQ